MEKEKTEEKEKQPHCPFNPTLDCQDCKLFIPYIGGGGDQACAFIIAAGK